MTISVGNRITALMQMSITTGVSRQDQMLKNASGVAKFQKPNCTQPYHIVLLLLLTFRLKYGSVWCCGLSSLSSTSSASSPPASSLTCPSAFLSWARWTAGWESKVLVRTLDKVLDPRLFPAYLSQVQEHLLQNFIPIRAPALCCPGGGTIGELLSN